MGQGDPEAKQKFILCLLLLQRPAPGPARLPSITPTRRPRVLIWPGRALGPVADGDEGDRAAGSSRGDPQRDRVHPSPPNPKPGRSALPSLLKENPATLHLDFTPVTKRAR